LANLSTKFGSESQEWETPASLFNPLNGEFCFTLDAAATVENTKVKGSFFTATDNGLIQPWGQNIVWLNPPYGAKSAPIQAWVKKAAVERNFGATSVLLIPARTNTNWFHDIILGAAEIRFVRGRPKFNGAQHGLPQPLLLAIFRPDML
jgi:phage N-6-adenine-methyltransferase